MSRGKYGSASQILSVPSLCSWMFCVFDWDSMVHLKTRNSWKIIQTLSGTVPKFHLFFFASPPSIGRTDVAEERKKRGLKAAKI